MDAGGPAADETGALAGELERAADLGPGDDVEGEEGGAVLEPQGGEDGGGPGAEGGNAAESSGTGGVLGRP